MLNLFVFYSTCHHIIIVNYIKYIELCIFRKQYVLSSDGNYYLG